MILGSYIVVTSLISIHTNGLDLSYIIYDL